MSSLTIEPCTTGIAARDFQWALRSVVGDDVFEEILGSIPREARDAVRAAATAAWVPLAHIGEVIDEACRRTRLDEDALLTRTTRMSTERTLNTVWRVLLRMTSDDAIITRTPLLWKRTRNVGELTVTDHGRGFGTLEVTGWPGMSRRSALILSVNIETVLTCAGRRGVRVEWGRTPDGARYQVTWRA